MKNIVYELNFDNVFLKSYKHFKLLRNLSPFKASRIRPPYPRSSITRREDEPEIKISELPIFIESSP